MKIPFTKMQGLGNDYIYIDCFRTPIDTLPDPAQLTAHLSPRRTSVGADGLVLILPSDKATARMRMFNADGSEGLMCGNAIRCVGKYLYERGLISPDVREITVETASGIKSLSLSARDGRVDAVSVDMGVAEVSDEIAVETAGKHYRMIPVSVGNPHWVCFVDDLCEVDAESEGARLSSAVEGGVNVEFWSAWTEIPSVCGSLSGGAGSPLPAGQGRALLWPPPCPGGSAPSIPP